MDFPVLVAVGVYRGQDLVNQLISHGIQIAAAFWGQVTEEGRWTLYLATDLVQQKGIHAAYLTIFDLNKKMPEPKIGNDDITLIDPSDPMAQMIIALQQHYRIQNPTWTGPQRTGSAELRDAYLYPIPQMANTP